ncbi:spermidine synthase [Legionella massiliensis]|uniref:Spermidine synthase n=1 Tax=Legionella massiliensis TaxID=1034943 RepID=A0A078KXE5_9GAMM|nr:hypothetical protein [Legionella massiliensis]CDZ79085.1 spermidine synthase [Legionella massiliensis]CEE14823.1 Spermidine synthase [Legionella massiliensis]
MIWKTFAGRCIYQSTEGTRVLQNPLFRWLQFNSKALQTVLCRFAPHRPQLNYLRYLIQSVQQKPQNCCMLGLGGGGAAHALSPIIADRLVIVEYSAEVIDLAKRFFMVDKLKNIDIIHDEASNYLNNCRRKFDHLLIDLYTAHSFPEQCANPDFFARSKELLAPDGILAVNLANSREHLSIFQLIQEQFLRSTVVLPVPDSANIIVFARNSETINPFLDVLKKSRKLKQLTWSSQWGYVARVKR